MSEACTWCGEPVAADDGLRARSGQGRATFCRLEHVVPWVMRGADWEPGSEPPVPDAGAACAVCGAPLGAGAVSLVRTRGPHEVADGLCGTEHLLAWAKAGGRYGRTPG